MIVADDRLRDCPRHGQHGQAATARAAHAARAAEGHQFAVVPVKLGRRDEEQRDRAGGLGLAGFEDERRLGGKVVAVVELAFAVGRVRRVPEADGDAAGEIKAGEVVVVVRFRVDAVPDKRRLAGERAARRPGEGAEVFVHRLPSCPRRQAPNWARRRPGRRRGRALRSSARPSARQGRDRRTASRCTPPPEVARSCRGRGLRGASSARYVRSVRACASSADAVIVAARGDVDRQAARQWGGDTQRDNGEAKERRGHIGDRV